LVAVCLIIKEGDVQTKLIPSSVQYSIRSTDKINQEKSPIKIGEDCSNSFPVILWPMLDIEAEG
jgi:hypothetical protein